MLRGTVLSPLGRPPPWLPPRGSLVGLEFVMLVGVCSPVTWRKRGFGVKEMLKYGRFLHKTRGIVYLCTVSPSGGCGLKRNNFYYCRLRLQPFTELSVWILQGAFRAPCFFINWARILYMVRNSLTTSFYQDRELHQCHILSSISHARHL